MIRILKEEARYSVLTITNGDTLVIEVISYTQNGANHPWIDVVDNLEPHYNINVKNYKKITAVTVEFRLNKKTAVNGDSIQLDGSLTFAHEADELNLNTVILKIQTMIKELYV